jgi:hypothetical protein
MSFQAGEKLPDGNTGPESDIAIKKVLQDKRFKVSTTSSPFLDHSDSDYGGFFSFPLRTENSKS